MTRTRQHKTLCLVHDVLDIMWQKFYLCAAGRSSSAFLWCSCTTQDRVSHTYGSIFPSERSHTIRGCSANVFKKKSKQKKENHRENSEMHWSATAGTSFCCCGILVPAAFTGLKSLHTLFSGQGGAIWTTTNWQRKLLLDSARVCNRINGIFARYW